ncbi:MAG: DUF6516 family protein [Pseudomonadota bacterium]
MFKLLKRYDDIVQDIQVERFRRVGISYELRAVLSICDGSKLYVKDYLYQDGTRKYAYHWQTKEGKVVGRWDNAPHWPHLKTFPHHFHNEQHSSVENSNIRNLESILEYIKKQLATNK